MVGCRAIIRTSGEGAGSLWFGRGGGNKIASRSGPGNPICTGCTSAVATVSYVCFGSTLLIPVSVSYTNYVYMWEYFYPVWTGRLPIPWPFPALNWLELLIHLDGERYCEHNPLTSARA